METLSTSTSSSDNFSLENKIMNSEEVLKKEPEKKTQMKPEKTPEKDIPSKRSFKPLQLTDTDKINYLRFKLASTDYALESKNLFLKQHTLKDAHLFFVFQGSSISPQQYGVLMESWIMKKYNYVRNKASDCIGDCKDKKTNKNIEIKVSLGGITHRKFNYVQIRFAHNIDAYLFTALFIDIENVDMLGELFVFHIKKEDLMGLVCQFGHYAHGTKKELGAIVKDDLQAESGKHKEYALRPAYGSECWKQMLKYRIDPLLLEV